MFSLNVGQRIGGIIVIAVVVFLIIGGVTYSNLGVMQADAGDIDLMQEIRVDLYQIEGDMFRSLTSVYEYILTGDEGEFNEFADARNVAYEHLEEARDYARRSLHPEEFLRGLDHLQTELDAYFADAAQMMDLWRAGREEQVMSMLEAEVLENDLEKIEEIINYDIDAQVAYRFLNEEREEFERAAANTRLTILLGIPLGTLVLIIMGATIAIGITRPLGSITDLVSKLAEGDFTVQADINSKDEIGQMAGNLNQTIETLSETLSSVQDSSDNVSQASQEIASGNQDLSQRTEEQASSLEEVASTIEEVTSSMETSSANAAEADNMSRNTLSSVRRGEEVVINMQDAMQEITGSSQEIAEIIAKVNDIAFQTNLLALNAAVEAARAGEQGRGFAVVAAEVRNLAGRAAESSGEIEKLIKNSIEKVNRGNALMEETQSVLKEIVTNNQKSTDVVSEIAASLREQTVATGDIRTAIEELNQVTQQNASLVEEIASASENMNSEAVGLSEQVGYFRLKKSGRQGNRSGTAKHSPGGGAKAVTVKKGHSLQPAKAVNRNKPNISNTDDDFDFDETDFEKF